MKIIKIKDKKFVRFISHSEIQKIIKNIAEQLNHDYEGKNPIFLGVLNGVFMYAAELMQNITVDCQIQFIKLSSYQGTTSTNNIVELIGLDESLKGRNIIVIEDIIDSGLTMQFLLEKLHNFGIQDVKIATFLFKPDAFRGTYKIDYIGKSIPNDFIVGYGFDYDGYGRNTPDIYKIVE